ncbi:PRC and DUF2382 domain-containing protein [Naumannella sp. ID2617S]|nr:PRC and DUF2382 domain-containing protein [Naumannella sp. ID2617S]
MRNHSAADLQRSTVYDNDGDKVGKVSQVFLDDATNEPTWVTVNTGLFGLNESFVPVAGARLDGDSLHVPYDKKQIKDAPNFDPEHHLDASEERALEDYYGGHSTGGRATDRDATTGVAERGGRDHDRDTRQHERVSDRDHDRGHTGDSESMVRREEELRVGTESHTAGKARLRKHVVTDTETVEVPVKREELHIEREPLSDAEAKRGGKIGDGGEEQVVTLREERAVVDKEVVGKEKVNIGKQTVTDTETVTEDVRKEKIDLDTDGKTGRDDDGRSNRR